MPELNGDDGIASGRPAGAGGDPVSREERRALFATLAQFDNLFLAVSGGADSLALMHLVADWLEEDEAAAGLRDRVCVLSVDHGLRKEAGEEARWVVARAGERGLRGEVLTVTAAAPESGVQEWAREVRYALLTGRVRQAGPRAALVSAHHEGDVAETVLMRLARGSGVDGLAGIEAVMQRDGALIVRPLLSVAKSRLVASLRARGLEWLEDPSNESAVFERVRLRRLGAERAALGLSDEALATAAGRLRRAREALDVMTDALVAASVDHDRLERCGIFGWPRRLMGALPGEIGVRLLMRALTTVGGTVRPPRLARVERLHDAMQAAGFAGATLGNCVIRPVRPGVDGGEGLSATEGKPDLAPALEIYREPARGVLPVIESDFATPVVWDNRFIVERVAPIGARATVRALEPGDVEAVLADEPGAELGADAAARMQLHDAFRATPVVEEDGGGLFVAALGRYRGGGEGGPMGQPYRARFMAERLYHGEEAGRRALREQFARVLKALYT